jgi:hypothetical protein
MKSWTHCSGLLSKIEAGQSSIDSMRWTD